jgi:hypothetical protein
MVIYCVFVIYDTTVYGGTQECDIIYCSNNNVLRVIYENKELIYDLDSIYDEYKISRVCLMIIVLEKSIHDFDSGIYEYKIS